MTHTEATINLVSEGDGRAIREVVSKAQQFQNDTCALMELHHPDVVIVNLAGRRVLGREAFATAMTQALDSPLVDIRTTLVVLDIRLPSPGVAIVSCFKTVHDDRADVAATDSLPASGALTYVMLRIHDSWRIALAQTTPSLP